jgi:hypothetical protein
MSSFKGLFVAMLVPEFDVWRCVVVKDLKTEMNDVGKPTCTALMQQGCVQTLADALASLVLELRAAAGVDLLGEPSSVDVARLAGSPESGLLAAAIQLRGLLQMSPDGATAMQAAEAAQGGNSVPAQERGAEVRFCLCDDGFVQLKAFHAGAVVDSFMCSDAALNRNMDELIPLLRGRLSLQQSTEATHD